MRRRRAVTAPCAAGGALDHGAHLRAPRRDRAELLEGRLRALGDDPRERRLARARRPVEHHRVGPALLDRGAQRRAVAEQVRLPDELLAGARGRTRAASGRRSGPSWCVARAFARFEYLARSADVRIDESMLACRVAAARRRTALCPSSAAVPGACAGKVARRAPSNVLHAMPRGKHPTPPARGERSR